MSDVAMIASMRRISQRVIQLWCRCAAEVKTSLSGQPSARSTTPAIISLLRRACQISGALRRHSFRRSAVLSRAIPSGASEPNQAARYSFASRGATIRLVAVTPE